VKIVCLILFAHRARPDYSLVLAANRDELHARPTALAGFFADNDAIFGGRDLVADGTWLGVTRRGRVAALTNVRSPATRKEGRSRGLIVRRVLEGQGTLVGDVGAIEEERALYPSHNLLAFEGREAVFASDQGIAQPAAGVHGLSNAALDTAWPKVVRGVSRMRGILEAAGPIDRDALFAILADRSFARDVDLPSTGVTPEIERMLSAAFIVSPMYGTRSSTLVLVKRDGTVDFEERSFSPAGELVTTVRQEFPTRAVL
jgi:uncharacterized protein with NRDE domain